MKKKAVRTLCLLLCTALLFSLLPLTRAEAAEADAPQSPSSEASVPEEPTEPIQEEGKEPEPPSEEATEGAMEGATEPTEETTASAEETTAPLEDTSDPTQETTAPTEEATEPTGGTTAPEENPTDPTEETTESATVPNLEISTLSEAPAERSIGTDEYGNTTFETFEDLKYLLAQPISEDNFMSYAYAGEGPLVISESITIPMWTDVYCGAACSQVTVPEGVTVTVAKNASFFSTVMQISGTVNVEGGLQIQDALTVLGKVNNGGRITLDSTTTLTGSENILYELDSASLTRQYYPKNSADWQAAVSAAKQETDPHVRYEVYICTDVTLSGSTVIGGNASLLVDVGATLRIPAGCTLEVNDVFSSSHIIFGSVIVEGTLTYNTAILINHTQGGVLQVSGGSLNGSGFLQVQCDSEAAIQSALPGSDLSGFLITKVWDNGWSLVSKEGKTQLGTPTELKWGYRRSWEWDETTQASKPILKEKPGFVCWKPAEPYQGHAEIKFFRQGESEPVASRWVYSGSTETPEYEHSYSFIEENLDSGTYYFTVTQMADGTEYYDGETAVSETWTYAKPEAALGECTMLSWNWPTLQVTMPENAGGVMWEVYYSPTENVKDAAPQGTASLFLDDDNTGSCSVNVWDSVLQEHGNGYYYMKTRALSSDITKWQNGPWSELSPAYCLSEATQEVNNTLDALIQSTSNTANPEEIRNSVQQSVKDMGDEGKQKLKDAMLADQSGTEAVAKIQELEARTNTTTVVEVTNEAVAFDQSKVTIVGAGLNEIINPDQDIKLVVDKPAEEHVIPAQYDNSVSVAFSMDLDNIQKEESNELSVPVKITLPVPSNINPDFLVILHYHADGSHEEIFPYIFQENGAHYASFVLTGFSDFVMVQKAEGPDDALEEFPEGGTVTLTLEPGVEKQYTFTPKANKNYIFVVPCSKDTSYRGFDTTIFTRDEHMAPIEADVEFVTNEERKGVYCELKAGTRYILSVSNPYGESYTGDVSLEEYQDVSALSIELYQQVDNALTVVDRFYTGADYYVEVNADPELEFAVGIQLSSSDTNILEFTEDEGVPVVKKSGSVTITASAPGGVTASRKFNVLDGKALEILEGANSTVTAGDPLTIRIKSENQDLQEIRMDGNIVEAGSYTVAADSADGSATVTFSADYLKSLNEGEHRIGVYFSAGWAFTKCRITNALLGDVNGDGKVNATDRMMLARYLAKWPGYTEENVNLDAANLNTDGAVDAKDRMILARHLAKWPGYEELPYVQ